MVMKKIKRSFRDKKGLWILWSVENSLIDAKNVSKGYQEDFKGLVKIVRSYGDKGTTIKFGVYHNIGRKHLSD